MTPTATVATTATVAPTVTTDGVRKPYVHGHVHVHVHIHGHGHVGVRYGAAVRVRP
ncbi:hypothetical protein [Streptomyces beigongshangae]|uniref:hypothetical protein n=1 Tax=Streptomyces beigongshangae TaxID=2841597 RepID=UPI001C85866E|nr:hypothetical protein [Streptomyces sp. REN17]